MDVIKWLEHSADTYPDKIAYEYLDKSITFEEFRNLSRHVGCAVKRRISEAPVAVLLGKDISTIAVYLGIVYSGNYYVPIDISMPVSRIEKILKNLNARLIISSDEFGKIIEKCDLDSNIEIVYLDNVINEEYLIDSILEGVERVCTDPLYVIYTSGSTGNPKGVVTSELALTTYIRSYAQMMKITEADVLANQSPLDYIAAIRDIYLPLYTGCKTVLFEKKLFMLPDQLVHEMNVRNITCAGWTASSMVALSKLHFNECTEKPNSLKKLCFSGSILPTKILREWQESLPDVTFVNQYGPTETTASCTYYIVDHLFEENEIIPIGVPYEGYKIIILDSYDLPVKINEIGEICVSGPAVALGYYDNIEYTKKSFVQNPLNDEYRQIIYKTGDHGSVDEDGIMWFHGRIDRQIKLMGHRIELDEVEACTNGILGINVCACIFDETCERLYLFYKGDIEERDLLKELRNKLPLFMVPRFVKRLDDIPILPNGKTDYKRLKQENIK